MRGWGARGFRVYRRPLGRSPETGFWEIGPASLPRVANYVERPEALRALRDALFSDRSRQPIALTALAGMGGIGKTVLAKALTEDEVVQQAFPDGVVWITIERESRYD